MSAFEICKKELFMSNANLKTYFITDMSFVNKLPAGKSIKLETKYSYNVKYAKDLTCRGELSVDICDKEAPENFRVKLVMVGIFGYKADADKDVLHIETYRSVFPYARAVISSITVNAGIPPIILPEVDLEGQNIYRIGRP